MASSRFSWIWSACRSVDGDNTNAIFSKIDYQVCQKKLTVNFKTMNFINSKYLNHFRRLTKVFQGYETMDKVKNEIFVYRAFNIVVELFNECVSSVMVLFLVTVGAVQIIPAALLIQQTNSDLQIPWALNIFLIVIFAEASFIRLCF